MYEYAKTPVCLVVTPSKPPLTVRESQHGETLGEAEGEALREAVGEVEALGKAEGEALGEVEEEALGEALGEVDKFPLAQRLGPVSSVTLMGGDEGLARLSEIGSAGVSP